MHLTILNVAYPLAPVGPNSVGGAEQVLTHLDAALVCAGHQSLVIAREGSRTAGTLLAVPKVEGVLTDETRKWAQHQQRMAIDKALHHWRVDLVHLHGIDFHEYLPPPGVPVLATLHLPPEWYPAEVFRLPRPGTFLNCVSSAQRLACPACASLLPEIENGVPTEALAGHHAKRQFVIALGRICPEKGFHIAMDAATHAGVPLLLAGKVFPYPAHEGYFEQEIKPRLRRGRHRFLGPLGMKRKRRWLSAARCLLVPSLVPETSSLVAMEALACGTPVVAFRAGALADIVEPGKTGFLVQDEQEMAAAIESAGSLDRNVCRESARTRFSLGHMADCYLAMYERLAKEKAASQIFSLARISRKESVSCAV